jgi:hypothetical protein
MVNRRRVFWAAVSVVLTGCVGAVYYAEFGPTAEPLSAMTNTGTPTIIALLPSSGLGRNTSPSVAKVTNPAHGSVRQLTNGRVEYRPAPLFFGNDSFGYTVTDWLGRSASANVTVTVHLPPPIFLKRKGNASLSEMLQQPPTSIYGSSINVFAYMDENGVTELDIAGHADTRTCSQASGLLANTLLTKGDNDGEFLLAGSSRIVGGRTTNDVQGARPDVERWLDLKQSEQISKIRGEQPDPGLEAELHELEQKSDVRSFMQNEASERVLREALDQFDQLSAESGLINIYRLPPDIPRQVRARVNEAIKSGQPSIIRFDDLLPSPQNGATPTEAVVFIPMLSTRTGDPVILDLPSGEFSSDKFREAVQEHRDAMEIAMAGNARERERLASDNLRETHDEMHQCKIYSGQELDRSVELTKTCTQDICYNATRPERISMREYCQSRLPHNESLELSWQQDAKRILDAIEKEKASNGGVIDSVTYAAVVDSMLRNWVLPVRGSQAAFDYWRVKRRGAAWEAAIHQTDAFGIDRRLLSGENIVFPVVTSTGQLRVEPMLAVDLKRSVVVVNKELGAVAVVSGWSERSATALDAKNAIAEPLHADPRALRKALETDPSHVMSQMFDSWAGQLPRHPADTAARAARGAEFLAAEEHRNIEASLAAFDPEKAEDWPKLAQVIFIAFEEPEATVETRLRAAFTVAQGIAFFSEHGSDPWETLRHASQSTASTEVDRRSPLYQALEGDPRSVVVNLLKKAADEDSDLVRDTLQRGKFLDRHSIRDARFAVIASTPASLLDLDAGLAAQVREGLTLRAQIDAILSLSYVGAPLRTLGEELAKLVKEGKDNTTLQEIEYYADKIDERLRQPAQQDAIFRAELITELQHLSDDLLRQTTDLNDEISVRFGFERELLGARLLYERGAYAESLDGAFPKTLPLALFSPDLRWSVINPTLKGHFTELRAINDSSGLLIAAKTKDGWMNILQINLSSVSDRVLLATSLNKEFNVAASDEPIADRILTLEVPLRPSMSEARAILQDPAAHLAALKAVAFSCAAPAAGIIALPADCDGAAVPRDGVTEGVRGGAELFRVPGLRELEDVALKRFGLSKTAPTAPK